MVALLCLSLDPRVDLARSHGPLGPTWRFLTSDCNISAVRNYELVVLHSFTSPLLQLVRTCQNWTSLKTSHVQNMVETCSIISQKPDVGLSKSSKDRPTRFKKNAFRSDRPICLWRKLLWHPYGSMVTLNKLGVPSAQKPGTSTNPRNMHYREKRVVLSGM